MKRLHFRWVALALFGGVMSAHAQEDWMIGTVKGYVSYREAIPLDDDSKLVVELFGHGKDNSPARVVASQMIMTGGR